MLVAWSVGTVGTLGWLVSFLTISTRAIIATSRPHRGRSHKLQAKQRSNRGLIIFCHFLTELLFHSLRSHNDHYCLYLLLWLPASVIKRCLLGSTGPRSKLAGCARWRLLHELKWMSHTWPPPLKTLDLLLPYLPVAYKKRMVSDHRCFFRSFVKGGHGVVRQS